MRRMNRDEMISLLTAVESVRTELRTCPDLKSKIDITDRLLTLYIALPVSDLIDFVSEAGTRNKGVA